MLAFSQGWPLYTAAAIASGMVIGFLWFAFRPRKYISEQSLSEAASHGPYQALNIRLYYVYSIWCPRLSKRQEFAVLEMDGEWFCIGVYPLDSALHRRRRFAFSGWTREVPNDRHIEPDDVRPYNPSIQGGGWDRLTRRITTN